MRLVIQRVAQASVTGGGKTASIERGLMVLVGIEATDVEEEYTKLLIPKLLGMRLFPDPNTFTRTVQGPSDVIVTQGALQSDSSSESISGEDSEPPSPSPTPDSVSSESAPAVEGKWSKSVMDIKGEILLVSQFTLFAVYKGTKPSFHRAMPPSQAESMYYKFVQAVKDAYDETLVKTCVFGSFMNVSLVNEGPVTLILDSNNIKGG